ncbi:mechanosensitive ion channel family protein [Gymnodinialimonas ceratoperidinii]|uniref:Mechanosensitive ion channel family protein n=1 Tax=Gymnodinialimonas ceratoperidinii TaxID=2856823 RepID=A0A8F6YE83_9RHOB|nr:mechanosensitive ion channel family protein [Gymnodinialimonas ceratoperidinii]QXT40957.1 mechanosensitive ion channel family protein [Gymnodinialimonas ceratoperidinii]
MTREPLKDPLDALLAQAGSDGPSPDLMARVLADAEAVQAARAAAQAVPSAATDPAPANRSWLEILLGALGGWSAISGITAAGVMGLAVGLYSPDTISGLISGAGLSYDAEAYAVTPDMAALWTEDGDV